MKAIAETLPPDQDSNVQGFVRVAIERLEFLRDHSGDDAETLTAARAVSRLAGVSDAQAKLVERALSSLRSLEPTARTKRLEAWSSDDRRPTIASASRRALKRLEGQ